MSPQSKYARKAKWLPFSMIPLFFIGAYFIYLRLDYESKDFYEDNFKAYPISERLKTEAGSSVGMKAYLNKDYATAASELTKRFEKDRDPEIGLHAGIARMHLQDYWAAIDHFQKVKNTPEYIDEAEWYKILSLLALERKDEVKSLLRYYCEQVDYDFMRDEALILNEAY